MSVTVLPSPPNQRTGIGFAGYMAWGILVLQLLASAAFLLGMGRPACTCGYPRSEVVSPFADDGSCAPVSPGSTLGQYGRPVPSQSGVVLLPPGLDLVPPLLRDDPGFPGDGRLTAFIASNEPGRILTMCVELNEIAEEPNTLLVGATRCLIKDPFRPGIEIRLLVPTYSQPGTALRARRVAPPNDSGSGRNAVVVLSSDGSAEPKLNLEYILSWSWPDSPPSYGIAGEAYPPVPPSVLTQASDGPRSKR